MKKKELERILQSIPPHPRPSAGLEQYTTPADVAADMLFLAAQLGDIEGRIVGDLGCGTGVLAIGAGLLGARRVVGVDIDPEALDVAQRTARAMGVELELRKGSVEDFREELDTVLMNPPFGAQRRHADRPFLHKAFECAPVIYSFHNAATEDFVRREAQGAGFTVTHKNKYRFSIPHMFSFHKKETQEVRVLLLRMEFGGAGSRISGVRGRDDN
ncbi:MAG: METTL5 family protein [Thermoplasmata archaeon]